MRSTAHRVIYDLLRIARHKDASVVHTRLAQLADYHREVEVTPADMREVVLGQPLLMTARISQPNVRTDVEARRRRPARP